ncbi:MAG: hypothetical protein CMJ35_03880 [Phycisphaerae bacterium]|nr:hypothetical protein [Phycisphaerae bacterium]MBM90739.1 hypothetical protein [Phycisphaerae bacterium]HCT46489.1 hypothetical protein [Phycisphaerales bacterium]
MNTEHDPHQTLVRARTLLRSHTTGTLLCDGTPYEALYIIDPSDGALVVSAESEMFEADDCVLVIPEDRFNAPIRVTLSLKEEPESGSTDRYLAYHQRQQRPRWARGKIAFAKVDSGGVADGDALMVPNPLNASISSLCKRLNNDPKALREVCLLLSKVKIEQPVAVGVDEEGCDVRAEFGVVRVQWPAPVPDANACEEVIASLLGGVS